MHHCAWHFLSGLIWPLDSMMISPVGLPLAGPVRRIITLALLARRPCQPRRGIDHAACLDGSTGLDPHTGVAYDLTYQHVYTLNHGKTAIAASSSSCPLCHANPHDCPPQEDSRLPLASVGRWPAGRPAWHGSRSPLRRVARRCRERPVKVEQDRPHVALRSCSASGWDQQGARS